MRLDSETGFFGGPKPILEPFRSLQAPSWERFKLSWDRLGRLRAGLGQLSGPPKLILGASCELFGASNRSRIGFRLILEAKMDIKI